jgi:hypothetical protein
MTIKATYNQKPFVTTVEWVITKLRMYPRLARDFTAFIGRAKYDGMMSSLQGLFLVTDQNVVHLGNPVKTLTSEAQLEIEWWVDLDISPVSSSLSGSQLAIKVADADKRTKIPE